MFSFRKQILNMEIKLTFWKLKQIHQNLKFTTDELKKILPKTVMENYSERMKATYRAKLESVKERNRRKFEVLKETKSDIIPTTKKEFIFNYVEDLVTVPPAVENILALGPKFGLPLEKRDIDMPTIIKDFEFGVRNLNSSQEEKDVIRGKGVNIITNFYQLVSFWMITTLY